jgi:hypothetical protein
MHWGAARSVQDSARLRRSPDSYGYFAGTTVDRNDDFRVKSFLDSLFRPVTKPVKRLNQTSSWV